MKPDRVHIDLVGASAVKASQDVQHIAVPCQWQTRPGTINDLISIYSAGGSKRTLVFCQTKKECNELSVGDGISFECQTLHGDITQVIDTVLLARFDTLITTVTRDTLHGM
jgi:ATP-dependent RNA helicase DDX21